MWPRTCSYLFPSLGGFSPLKLKHFRHLFWVEWSPLRFWKNAANEESALRGKTTPLQSGSLVSKLNKSRIKPAKYSGPFQDTKKSKAKRTGKNHYK